MENFKQLLIQLNLCTEESIIDFYPKVRDRDDISVLKCQNSGVIFLSSNKGGDPSQYEGRDDLSYWASEWDQGPTSTKDQAPIYDDDYRRKEQIKELISGKNWADLGCGLGGLLRLLHHENIRGMGIEPQKGARDYLEKQGIQCLASLEDVPDESLDVVTLFHVFEHLPQPLEVLGEIQKKLKTGGKLIIEIPQANDALISLYDLDAFKAFTFWSEHLILHTRESLKRFIESQDKFKVDSILGFQKYPLSNHLHWLTKNKPGGHIAWNFLDNPTMREAYEKTLQSLDKTDTLIAYATKQ